MQAHIAVGSDGPFKPLTDYAYSDSAATIDDNYHHTINICREIPIGERDFSLHNVYIGSGVHPGSYQWVMGAVTPG
jgi:hypothetical protein